MGLNGSIQSDEGKVSLDLLKSRQKVCSCKILQSVGRVGCNVSFETFFKQKRE